jgi:hypothetical protein
MNARLGWVTLIAGAFCVLGCKRATEDDVRRSEAIRVRACDCQDRACAEHVLAEFKGYVAELSHKAANPDQTNRIQDNAKRTTTCMLRKGVAVASIRATTP